LKKFLVQIGYDILGFLLSVTGLSFSSRQCKQFLKEAANEIFDVIIVPGLPYNGKRWDIIMKGRIYWAKYLFDKGMTTNIIFSGSAVHTNYVESRIMALYAEAIGIPAANIFTEEKAEHSTENVYFSYQLALQMGFSKIALASDPFQSKLLRKYVSKKVCSEMVLIPIVFDILRDIEVHMSDPTIDASSAFVAKFKPLREREHFRKRFRGTRGKNINNTM
jgi:hypothetical protein